MAIKLLLDSGDISRADKVFVERLRDGNDFRDLPAPADGLWCVQNFIRSARRRTECAGALGADRFASLLGTAGLFAMLAGEPKLAAEYYKDAAEITRSKTTLWRLLQNRGILFAHLGSSDEATYLANRALSTAREEGDKDEIRSSLACLAYVLAMRGCVEPACQMLEDANHLSCSSADSPDNLTHTDGILHARVLIWLGETGRASELTRRNLKLCKDTDNANVARCHFVLGQVALTEGQLANCRQHLDLAESVMRQTHQLLELPLVLAVRADLHRRTREWPYAIRCVQEALDLSASREWGIAQTDSLLMRGWIMLDRIGTDGGSNRAAPRKRFDAWVKHVKINRSFTMYGGVGWATQDPKIWWEVLSAHDDAENALRLARRCGYFWAQRGALLLLSEACFALGDFEDSLKFQDDAKHLPPLLPP